MAPYLDYPQVTKLEKCSYNAIKKSIFLKSQELGSGKVSPVPYDTAWVARVPETNKLSRPAFPGCLQWLRDHQKQDGSWGEEHPSFLHSKILNTFAAALALSQWNYPEDKNRIKKAIEALTILASTLQKVATNGKAFEMIISGLMHDARELKLDMSYAQFEWHSKIGKERLKEVESQIISNKPNKYWALLETTSRTLDFELECFRAEITEHGLIAAQPSTTAYALRSARLRGKDFPEAEWALEKLCVQNKGGMPHLSPCDNFETIYGLDFLFKADINPRVNVKFSATKKALKVLKEKMGSRSEVGFSSRWQSSDDGCTEAALRVLSQSACVNQELESIEIPDSGFTTSSQVNSISELVKNHTNVPKIDDWCEPSLNAKENSLCKVDTNGNKSFLSSIWNVSVYYKLLQQVFAPQNDAETESKIMQFIGKSQNNDGGWSGQETSTAEETAYVCLTVFRLVKNNSQVLDSIDFPKLVDFMNSVKTCQRNNFWCYKVVFHPCLVSEVAIAAAKYTIFQIQRLHAMTTAFNDNRLDFFDVQLYDIADQPLFQGRFLLSFPEVRREEIEVDKQEVTNICNGFYAVEFPSNHVNALIDHCLEMTYLIHPVFMPPYERAIETSLMVFLYLVDDIFDFFLHEKNNLLNEVNELLEVVCKILRGKYPNIESVPALAFPRFAMLARGCFHYWKMMEQKNWNAESLVTLMEKHIFKAYADDYRMKCLGVELTAKMYLHLHKNDSGIDEVIHQNSRLHDASTDSTEFLDCELFVKFKDHCRKATRVISDVVSVLKDVSESRSDNYCVPLQEDYKVSLREALARATRKGNKEVLKMYSLKHMILKDPVYGSNKRLLLHMQLMENLLFGGLIWSTETPRYLKKVSAERLHYKEKDLQFIWDLCFKFNE